MPPPPPPTGSQPLQGRGDQNERLNRMFAEQTESATPSQRAAVKRWQRTDRFYENVQDALVGGDDAEAVRVAQDLSDLAIPLPEGIEVWRGVRSTVQTFGSGADDLQALTSREWVEGRFMSTTTSRNVATPEFTRPGVAPAILRVKARAGASAIWIPPLGHVEKAGQQELCSRPA